VKAVAVVTRDPQRLEALCLLWQSAEREIWITLKGTSMCPTILPGTRLLLRCHRRDIAVGAIVAYRFHGALVVHRLEKILDGDPQAGRQLVCRGDNVEGSDPPIPVGAVVGEVVRIGAPAWQAWMEWQGRRILRFGARMVGGVRRRVVKRGVGAAKS
jgi:hypothetical protein